MVVHIIYLQVEAAAVQVLLVLLVVILNLLQGLEVQDQML